MSMLTLEVKNLFFFYGEGSNLVKLKVGFLSSKLKSEVKRFSLPENYGRVSHKTSHFIDFDSV
jgi:hypothetical protein